MTHPFDKAREAAAIALANSDGHDWKDMPPYREGYYRQATIAINAALSALAAHGYVLVPVEPTETMMVSDGAFNRESSRRVYRAALAAWKKETGK